MRTIEPEQTGERRADDSQGGNDGVPESRLSRAGRRPTPAFFPLLVLDAVLTGAKGLNLWSSFRAAAAAAQRAPVSRAGRDAASRRRCPAALLPTEQPFLYTVSVTATEGTPLGGGRAALLEELDGVRRDGITDAELVKAKAQLQARLVFDNDSVTNIAHQLGYFETIAERRCVHDAAARGSPR